MPRVCAAHAASRPRSRRSPCRPPPMRRPGRSTTGRSSTRRAASTSRGASRSCAVRDASGDVVVAAPPRQAARFRMRPQAAAGPLPGHQLPAPCDGNCGFARPARGPLLSPRARPLRRAHRGEGPVRPGRGCTMTRQALPARFPPRRAHPRGAALPARAAAAINSWALIDTLGPAARTSRRTASYVIGQPREGDAARRLPARHRQPDAGRRRARACSGPMITVSVERRCRQRSTTASATPRSTRSPGSRGMTQLLRGRLLGQRPLQRRGPGALLQPHRPAGPAALARLRARPPVLDRLLPALGLLALRRHAARLQDLLQGRLARHGAPASSCTRRRCSSAADTRFSMAVLTDGNPSHEYGTETLRGVAQRIFRAAAPTARRADPRRPARRHPPRRARGRAPLRARDPREPRLPHASTT